MKSDFNFRIKQKQKIKAHFLTLEGQSSVKHNSQSTVLCGVLWRISPNLTSDSQHINPISGLRDYDGVCQPASTVSISEALHWWYTDWSMWQRISSFIIFCYSYTVHCLGCGKHKTQSISCKTPTQTYCFPLLYQCISAAHKLITTTTLAQWITIHSHLFVILIHIRKTEWETLKADARPTNPLTNHMWVHVCFISQVSPPPFFSFASQATKEISLCR